MHLQYCVRYIHVLMVVCLFLINLLRFTYDVCLQSDQGFLHFHKLWPKKAIWCLPETQTRENILNAFFFVDISND